MKNCIYLDRVFFVFIFARNTTIGGCLIYSEARDATISQHLSASISKSVKNQGYFGLRPKSYSNIICIYLFLINSSDLFLDPCSDKRGPFFVFVHIIQKVILHQPTKRRQKKEKKKARIFLKVLRKERERERRNKKENVHEFQQQAKTVHDPFF